MLAVPGLTGFKNQFRPFREKDEGGGGVEGTREQEAPHANVACGAPSPSWAHGAGAGERAAPRQARDPMTTLPRA